jgi:hypothetical protein
MSQNCTLASSELMDMQPELLIEVHQQFRLRPEVLFLAMNIVDRYVSKRVVYKKHYQLVGCAALWIAAKFEDGKDKVPLVRELADMCCKAYDESAFIQMEGHVLSTISWVTGHPSAEAWLRTSTQEVGRAEDPKVQNVARFLMEITLFHREFVGIQSSFIAEGALMLARFICNKPRRVSDHFTPSRSQLIFQAVSKYDNIEAHNITVRIAFAIDKHFAEKLEGVSEIVIRKYAPTYYGRASTIVREWYLSGRRFVYQPEPSTPVSAALITPGLQPSGSWPGQRSSWMSTSPSNGSISCASSEAGDDAPVTPITPLTNHDSSYPFAVATSSGSIAKENMPPQMYGGVASMSNSSTDLHAVGKAAAISNGQINIAAYQAARGPLHPIRQSSDGLALPGRTHRRLSN